MASTMAKGADGMLDAELLQVWFRQSGTMFRGNLSIFKTLPLVDAMSKVESSTATMATRLDLASFFHHQLECTQGMEINFCILS